MTTSVRQSTAETLRAAVAGYVGAGRALRRGARRRRRAAPAVGREFARRGRAAARTLTEAQKRGSPVKSTRTASPTTSTRPPTGRSVRGALDVLPLIVTAHEWERARARPAAARAAARTPSPPTSTARRRCCAKGCCRRRWSSGIQASCAPATASARRAASFCICVAFDLARGADGRMAGRRHAHAGAVGRRLRAREPRHHLAAVARRVSRAARPGAVAVLPRAAADAVRGRAVGRRRAARRPAHARARTTRPTSSTRIWRAARLPARRGRRPDRARRPRLPEDRLRSPAASTRFCAVSTTTTAIRSSCGPTRRSACPGSCRRGARATCSSPTRSASACSNRRRCRVSARRSASGCSASRSRRRSIATWWCGETAALDDARRRLRGRRDQAGVRRRVDGAGVRLGPRRERAPRMG